MYYLEQKCPVCGEAFSEDSDTVVCPQCGTPHHRECYMKNGGCANAQKHDSGYNYRDEHPVKEPEIKKENKQEPPMIDFFQGQSKGENNSDPERADMNSVYGFLGNGAIAKDTDIGGISAKDYTDFLGNSAFKYVPRFLFLNKFDKKSVWNLFAFIFPFTFAAYKRMYKLAAILLTLDMLFFGVGVYGVMNKEPVKAVSQLFVQISADGVITKEESELFTESLNKLSMTQINPDWTDYFLNLKIIDNILMGLFATYLYMKTSERKIKTLREAELPPEVYETLLKRLGKGAFLLPIMGYVLLAMTVFTVFSYGLGF